MHSSIKVQRENELETTRTESADLIIKVENITHRLTTTALFHFYP